MISSATSKWPTNRAKNTICCSRVNLIFSACSKTEGIVISSVITHLKEILTCKKKIVNTKYNLHISSSTLRNPCCSPSYSIKATGTPLSFNALWILRAWSGGTTWLTPFATDQSVEINETSTARKNFYLVDFVGMNCLCIQTLSSSPWNKITGHENLSTELIGDLSKYSISLPGIIQGELRNVEKLNSINVHHRSLVEIYYYCVPTRMSI